MGAGGGGPWESQPNKQTKGISLILLTIKKKEIKNRCGIEKTARNLKSCI